MQNKKTFGPEPTEAGKHTGNMSYVNVGLGLLPFVVLSEKHACNFVEF